MTHTPKGTERTGEEGRQARALVVNEAGGPADYFFDYCDAGFEVLFSSSVLLVTTRWQLKTLSDSVG